MNKVEYQTIDEVIYSEVLDNGLQVFLLPRANVRNMYATFVTDFGANDLSFIPRGGTEKVTVPDGVAHFLEHKLFEKEDHDAFQEFMNQGAAANAYTSATQTAYLFSTTDNKEQNVKTLLDFVQAPYFSDESVEKEKGIIVQEAQMYHDQPDHRVSVGIQEAMYHHHGVRNEVLGTLDSIQSITKEDLYTCYHTFYHPSNMVLFIAGGFDPERMMELIKENQNGKDFAPPEEIIRFTESEPTAVLSSEKTITMLVHVQKSAIGIKEDKQQINSIPHVKRVLLNGMLLDYFFGKSGPFYNEMYAAGLIDYSFNFMSNAEKDHGYSLIASNAEDPDAFAAHIKELLLSIKDQKLTEAEFARMKKRKIGTLIRGK